jgi:hypothetical protein
MTKLKKLNFINISSQLVTKMGSPPFHNVKFGLELEMGWA